MPSAEASLPATIGVSVPSRKRAPFGHTFVAIPVRTRLVQPGDDLPALVAESVRGIAREHDIVAISETAVAIAQNRMIRAETIRPSKLALVLSRRAGAMATICQPESMQLVIDDVGAWRVLYAAVAQIAGRLIGRRGMFYSVLGEAISAIDGYTGTLPPFETTIVLGPQDPDRAAREIASRAGTGAAIVDANDLGIAKVLGASQGVDREGVERALRANPHGNGDEQTPIVVVCRR